MITITPTVTFITISLLWPIASTVVIERITLVAIVEEEQEEGKEIEEEIEMYQCIIGSGPSVTLERCY